MTVFNVFSLLGGLALFLFGMDIMGKALEKQAGGQLQKILSKLTDNPLKGFFLGLCVTAVIQSSSATTVMVVGFVNSGIMELHQAIGVIMGSNVGTTVTSWILSLSGLQGDSFLINMLKPTSFSPVLAFIGILLYMGKNEKRRGVGTILIGFAVLMTGMTTMSNAVLPLQNEAWFTSLFIRFSNPLLGVLVGAVVTGIIQSSSASVGILQALSATGVITYGPRLHGVHNKAELDELVESSLQGAALWNEVKDRLKKSALGLSGGQQQRLCIARALAVKPEVLLMDEPTSALDPGSTMKVEELMSELKKNYTVVIVTHNMQQAARISDRTAFFLLGELVEAGPTAQIFSTPQDKRTEDYISGRFG